MTDLEQPEQRWLDWVAEASAAVGVDPAEVDIVKLHHLSKQVAHRLERPLAPVSTFILGLPMGSGAAGTQGTGRPIDNALSLLLQTLPSEQPRMDSPAPEQGR